MSQLNAGHDTILVSPTKQELTAALTQAVKAANARCRTALVEWSPQACSALWRTLSKKPEGWRQWLGGPPGPRNRDNRSALAVAWWTDRLNRQHVRVKGARWSFSYERDGLNNILCPYVEERPPVWMIYPNFIYLAGQTPPRVLAACPCGVVGSLEAIGWLGDRCAACHDRHEEGQSLEKLGDRHLWAPLTIGSNPTVAFSPAGDLLAAGAHSEGILIRDLHSGATQSWKVVDRARLEQDLCFLPDGTLAITERGGVGIYESWTGKRCGGFLAESYLERLIPSPDGTILAIKASANRMSLWDLRTGERLATISPEGEAEPVCAVFHPDGRSLFLGLNDGTVRRWSVTSRRQEIVWSLPGNDSRWIQELAISPDGRFLASLASSLENNLLLSDVFSGKLLSTWTLDRQAYHARLKRLISFAPDGRTLAASERRGVVKFWDVLATNSPVSLVSSPEPEIQSLAFSPDSHWLAVGGVHGRDQIKFWPWAALLAAAREAPRQQGPK